MAYTPLRISTVKPNRELTFDLYIFFKETYLRYSQTGESLTDEKFGKLKIQNIAKFFITENDEINYQRFLDKLLNETMTSATISVDEKVHLIDGACSTAIERMQKDPESEISYKMTQSAAKNLRQIISSNPESLKKIFGKKVEDSDRIIKHSLNVSALSTKLAEFCELEDHEIEDIATAGLIHDIGIGQLPAVDQELFIKAKDKFSADDKRLYAFHVKDAVAVLKEKPWVNANIMELVVNHEENRSGSGPNKKKKLTPSEEIISLVNVYDKYIIANGHTPKEAIKNLGIDQLGNYDLDLINKFKKVLVQEGMLEE